MIPKITYDNRALILARDAFKSLWQLADHLKLIGQKEQSESLAACLKAEELEFLNLSRCEECNRLFGESEGRETQIDYWCCAQCAELIDPKIEEPGDPLVGAK